MRKEHNAKLHILKALSDSDFHSGEALGRALASLEQQSQSTLKG